MAYRINNSSSLCDGCARVFRNPMKAHIARSLCRADLTPEQLLAMPGIDRSPVGVWYLTKPKPRKHRYEW